MTNSPVDVPPPSLPPARRSLNTSVILFIAFVFVFVVFLPLWKPLVLGSVFAAAASKWHNKLAKKFGERRYLSAGLATALVVVLILTPLLLIAVVAVRQATAWVTSVIRDGGFQNVLDPLPDSVARYLQPLLDKLPTKTLKKLPEGSMEAGTWAAAQLQAALVTISDITFEIVMMLIAFFFLLTDGARFTAWLKTVSPLGRSRTQELFDEFRLVSRSLIGSNLITGLAQSIVATIGYVIAGAPSPMFFGTLTFLTSFIPSVGTAIVFLPLAGLLVLMGKTWASVFLVVWGVVFVGLIDNLLRPLLMSNDVQVHGAVLFLAIIGGIMVFGVAGLVLGPMALTTFLTMMRFHARDLRQAVAAAPPPPP